MSDADKVPYETPRRVGRDELPLEESSGLKLDEVVHIFFCHKWKIILMALAGLVVAGVAWFAWPKQYVSEAKILIRYVVESRPVSAMADQTPDATMKSPDTRGDSIMNSEMEIITSRDLAEQVAEEIGPDKILQGRTIQGDRKLVAGGIIVGSLQVEVARKSSVIRLLFSHPDPAVARQTLATLTTNYLQKHVDIHRTLGIYDPIWLSKSDELNAELASLEGQIRNLKTNHGVVSFDEAKRASVSQSAKVSEEILATEAELASLQALVARVPAAATNSNTTNETNQTGQATDAITNLPTAPLDFKSPEYLSKSQKYRDLQNRLNALEIRELEMRAQNTDEFQPLRVVRSQIAELYKQKSQMEQETPALLLTPATPDPVRSTISGSPTVAPVWDPARITSLQAKLKTLTNQIHRLQDRAIELDIAEARYNELTRKKSDAEASLKRVMTSLEQSRIDKNLGPGNVSNIGIIQAATPPFLDAGKKIKVVAGILAGFLAGGFAWAFLLEMFLSPAIRRPSDLKEKLKMPVFLWIPEVKGMVKPANSDGNSPLPDGKPSFGGEGQGEGAPASSTPNSSLSTPHSQLPSPWDSDHQMRHYFEALRDRLINYFEVKNMTHKPKLVAVTSCSPGAGVSTLAAGLAALFSETGDGNVLLVDMNHSDGAGAAHPFYRGKPGCGLMDALEQEKREPGMVQENLYIASVADGNGKLSALMPKKFSNLVPRMKASDYDYIIFDMPPVDQTSISTRLARHMDINLVVVEAEADAPAKVREAVEMLKETRANVAGVLNRRQFHLPKQLRHDV